jgi:hypothetical protein
MEGKAVLSRVPAKNFTLEQRFAPRPLLVAPCAMPQSVKYTSQQASLLFPDNRIISISGAKPLAAPTPRMKKRARSVAGPSHRRQRVRVPSAVAEPTSISSIIRFTVSSP